MTNFLIHHISELIPAFNGTLWWPRSAKEIFFEKKGPYIKSPVSNLKISFPI